jgi:hypothetical protein
VPVKDLPGKKYTVNTICLWFLGAVGMMVKDYDLVLTEKCLPVLTGI